MTTASRDCLVIAHRGASGTRPENTVEAFRHARALGADWVELDVRRSADGVLVVHHDARLGDGRTIVATDAADLPPSVPTLVEALEACEGMGVNVEIKNLPEDPDYDADHGVAVAVAGLVRAFLPPERVVVSSFTMGTIDRLRAIDPELPTGWLTFDALDPRQLVERTVAHGHGCIHPWVGFVTPGFIRLAHDAGLRLLTWTVDDPVRMAELAVAGVDGIITNHPDRAREVLSLR
jgi:glycerophosphoryl diester phosphodiesterase